MPNIAESIRLKHHCYCVASTLEYTLTSTPQQYERNITLAIKLLIVADAIEAKNRARNRYHWSIIHRRTRGGL